MLLITTLFVSPPSTEILTTLVRPASRNSWSRALASSCTGTDPAFLPKTTPGTTPAARSRLVCLPVTVRGSTRICISM